MILKLRFALHQNSSSFGLLPSYNNISNNQASVPKSWSQLWILNIYICPNFYYYFFAQQRTIS